MSDFLEPKEIPNWILTINDKSGITTKDIMMLFGFTMNGLHASIRDGCFPKPDYKLKSEFGRSTKKRLMWRKQTILAEIERRQDANNKQPLADTAPPDADRG